MFDTKEEIIKRHQQKVENELLEIFCLIEENTMQTRVEAIRRYCNLFSIKDKLDAVKKMNEAYTKFTK